VKIPVVILSADATSDQIRRLFAAGASDYLTKPLDVRRVLETVDLILTQRGSAGPARS
jgi:DNA-binding response OmpR family regulator